MRMVVVEDKPRIAKFNFLYVILSILAIIVGLGIFLFTKKPVNSTSANVASNPTAATKTINMAEVGKHADQNSCWMVIGGSVYDVTSFITEHPGGLAILGGCGKDASLLFNGRANYGTSHSSRARNMLLSLQIGVLTQ